MGGSSWFPPPKKKQNLPSGVLSKTPPGPVSPPSDSAEATPRDNGVQISAPIRYEPDLFLSRWGWGGTGTGWGLRGGLRGLGGAGSDPSFLLIPPPHGSEANLHRYEVHPLGTFPNGPGPEFKTTVKVKGGG